MIATPLRRAIALTTVATGVLAALFWGVGVTLAPDRLMRHINFEGRLDEACFSPDGRLLVGAGSSIKNGYHHNWLTVWDSRTWAVVKQIPSSNYLCGFSFDGSFLLTVTGPRTAVLWDTRSWRPVRTYNAGFRREGVHWAHLSADGTRVTLLEGRQGRLRVRDARTKKLIRSGPSVQVFELRESSRDSRQVAYFAPDSGGGGGIWIFNAATGSPPRYLAVTSIAFSLDGRIAAGTDLTSVTLWNPKTWAVLRCFPRPGPQLALCISTSREGRLIGVGTGAGTYLYDAATGWELARFPADSYSPIVVLSPDGSKLALPGENEVQIWEIGSRDRLMARALFRHLTGRR